MVRWNSIFLSLLLLNLANVNANGSVKDPIVDPQVESDLKGKQLEDCILKQFEKKLCLCFFPEKCVMWAEKVDGRAIKNVFILYKRSSKDIPEMRFAPEATVSAIACAPGEFFLYVSPKGELSLSDEGVNLEGIAYGMELSDIHWGPPTMMEQHLFMQIATKVAEKQAAK